MTYQEFKRNCGIHVSSGGIQRVSLNLQYELESISFFINIMLGESIRDITELLGMIEQLEDEDQNNITIKKADFEMCLMEDDKKDQMVALAAKIPRNVNGDLLIKKQDYILEIAYNFGIIGFLKLLGPPPTWEHDKLFPYTETSIKIDTQLCKILTIRKDESVIAGWEPFPEALIYKTSVIRKYLEYWKRFLEEYENGQIPNILPTNKIGQWVIVPKEYVKDEYLKKLNE